MNDFTQFLIINAPNKFQCPTDLNVVGGKQSDHGIHFSFVPILVHLPPDMNDVSLAEGQFAGWLPHEVVESFGDETRFGGPRTRFHLRTQVVYEVVVSVEGDRRLLGRYKVVRVPSTVHVLKFLNVENIDFNVFANENYFS